MPQMQLDPVGVRLLFGEEKGCPPPIPVLGPDGTIILANSGETGAEGEEGGLRAGDPSSPPYIPDDLLRRLRELAAKAREEYIGRKLPRGNAAAARLELDDGTVLEQAATSKTGPLDRPIPRSEGGQFEPGFDPVSGRKMNTDAEYKLYSWAADHLEASGKTSPRGTFYLYTEIEQCSSCKDVQAQFEARYPRIRVIVQQDYPYPFPR